MYLILGLDCWFLGIQFPTDRSDDPLRIKCVRVECLEISQGELSAVATLCQQPAAQPERGFARNLGSNTAGRTMRFNPLKCTQTRI